MLTGTRSYKMPQTTSSPHPYYVPTMQASSESVSYPSSDSTSQHQMMPSSSPSQPPSQANGIIIQPAPAPKRPQTTKLRIPQNFFGAQQSSQQTSQRTTQQLRIKKKSERHISTKKLISQRSKPPMQAQT